MASNTAHISSIYKNIASATLAFVRSKGRWFIVAFWLITIAIYWYSTQAIAPSPVDKVKLLCDIALTNWWGPLFFIVTYAVQPLVFFPTFLMTIAAGILYGPVWGMLYSFVGANAAASLSYGVGRLLGADTLGHLLEHPRIANSAHKLRTNTFETIIILGLLHAPFDVLNFTSGILRLRWWQFALATAIAMIPGSLPFVLFGSSLGAIENLKSTGRPELNLTLFGLSIAIALIAMASSTFLRKRIS